MVDGVAEQPEGGPEALLLVGAVVAEADGRFELGEFAGVRGEGLLGLDAGGGPFAVLEARHELDGAAARELEVGVGGGVGLEFVVDVEAGGWCVSERNGEGGEMGKRGMGKGGKKKGRVTR